MQMTNDLPIPVRHALAKGVRPLKALREWRGLTQDALADRSCLSISQIQRAERGGDVPHAAMRLMARVLEVDESLLSH